MLTSNFLIDIFKRNFSKKRKFNFEHVSGEMGEYEDYFCFFFDGSNDKIDWIYDFKFWHKKIPYEGASKKIKVHTGFIDSYRLVRPWVHAKIEKYDKIIISGFSLGGAIATLCALDIKYNFENKEIILITAGSPRVGNKFFVESFNKREIKTYRLVYGNDIVAKLPPIWFGYKHIIKDICLNYGGSTFNKIFGDPKEHNLSLYTGNLIYTELELY